MIKWMGIKNERRKEGDLPGDGTRFVDSPGSALAGLRSFALFIAGRESG